MTLLMLLLYMLELILNLLLLELCYTYRDVVGNQLIKRVVSVRDAFPVPNDNMFAEDYDMFAERRMY